MVSGRKYEVGQWVEWIHCGRGSMTRTGGPIHEIDGDRVRVCRGKNGRKDYWLPIANLISEGHDPLKSLVSAVAEGYRDRERSEAS